LEGLDYSNTFVAFVEIVAFVTNPWDCFRACIPFLVQGFVVVVEEVDPSC